MDRLTGWDNGHAYFTECFEEPCLGMGCINEDCEFKILACQRLAEYEDIGLTPEQLLEIDKMYLEKCREVAELGKQQRWIPCSERLPDSDIGGVLIYTKDGGIAEGQYYPTIESWKQFRWSVEDAKVIAWMPLPEPYKPE